MKTMTVNTTVNGASFERTVDVRTSLADFLRHGLCLTGTHVGCEHGACGACTVQLDGAAVRSCLMLAVQADSRKVTTVEALGSPDALSALQKAFSDHHALQCGFCTPGFLVTVQSWLDEAPPDATLTDEQLRDLLSGNMCRCTGYQNIIDAVRAVLRDRQASARLAPTT